VSLRRPRWWPRRSHGAGSNGAGSSTTGPERREPTGGVSSWHLWWTGLPTAGVAEAAVTLEVTEPPRVDRLYFWALQATFADGTGRHHGAAHLGLQWNPRHPGARAVNWGGYAQPPAGGILAGTPSALPSTPDDPNTRDYPWVPGRAYRLRIARGGQGWAGVVTDLADGRTTVVRELLAGGDRLRHVVVWSELFCRCDHPPVEVRWSGFEAVGLDGAPHRPDGLRVSFPPASAGDCRSTDVLVEADGRAVRQRIGEPRTWREGAPVRWA